MKQANRWVTALAGVGAAFVFALAAAPPALGAQDPNLVCRTAIEGGLRRWFANTFSARQECQNRTILGQQKPETDCLTGLDNPELAARLAQIDAQLGRTVTRRCLDADWALLSYPGPCKQDMAGTEFDGGDLLRCMKRAGGDVLDTLFLAEYPPPLDVYRGDEADCILGTLGRSSSMLTRDMKARFRCQLGREAGDLGEAVDCHGVPQPYGFGTNDDKVDNGILRAYLSVLSGSPHSCAFIDLDTLGYGENCPDPSGGSFDFRDLKKCVFDTNQIQVANLMEVAFPSSPVCGNGVLQEGEECDHGTANSDSVPGACRKNCRLASCGDGVTDPGNNETCDDGDTAALDGCNSTCQVEFCGDGTLNGNPPEQCEDGNHNANDRCTNFCTNAVCGDGIVCSDPACTSGPAGGVEQCDAGGANAADAACHTDCSGFRHTCTLTIGVTSNETLGALLYEIDYGDVPGEFLGTLTDVKCTSLVTGALFTFRDEDAQRTLRESVIQSAGFTGPMSVATCSFASNNASLAGSAFPIAILDASSPNFDPLSPTVAVTSVSCAGQ